MIDLKVLTDAVGDLDEDKLMGMLNDFVASKPTENQGLKPDWHQDRHQLPGPGSLPLHTTCLELLQKLFFRRHLYL